MSDITEVVLELIFIASLTFLNPKSIVFLIAIVNVSNAFVTALTAAPLTAATISSTADHELIVFVFALFFINA
ncbi:hypothetical protein BCD_1608 (plasmid) [Borrelia crocidurae DOU]|uniref:Uncharacterized protein n=1 Tax=Borrelia crocidurae DOU TaxID=1293575 RepID=W5SKH9_9SPIR|nr:hypothetical protein BCD_1608 [Borrelia crocidurae DOU]